MSESICIDPPKSLSQSLLWQFQRDFFDQQGIEAWQNQVPFYVTSNPYIAHSYATMSIQFIRDYTLKHPESKADTFYLIELGTGPGCFSFLMLKQIMRMRDRLGMQDIKICYVMSDFTQSNLAFWQSNPSLTPFVEAGVLDFAIFNMETDHQIHLVQRNIDLNQQQSANPWLVFANYIFDTVSHDCFYYHNQQVQEALVSLDCPEEDFSQGHLKNFDRLKVSFSPESIDSAHYDDPDFNALLEYYRTHLNHSYCLLPITSLRTLKNLRAINPKLVLIASDKGYSSLEQLDHLGKPGISFHGSFSLMVNFHAIGSYFKNTGGDAVLQTPSKGIDTFVGLSGLSFDDLPGLRHSAEQLVETMSPAHYFLLHRRVSDHFESYDAATLASHLAFTHWDPHIFKKLVRRLCQIVDETDATTLKYLAAHMLHIADNFYAMKGTYDVFFDIGLFLQHIKDYKQSKTYFEKSQAYFGTNFKLHYQLGISCYHMDQFKQALLHFQEAKQRNSQSKQTKKWIQHIKRSHAVD